MNDVARRLRAQKVFSTDPEYLERLARAEEACDLAQRVDGREQPSRKNGTTEITVRD